MVKAFSLNRNIYLLGIPVAMALCLFALVNSTLFIVHSSKLATAITIDFVISIPLVYYFIIRKTSIPAITVVPIMIVGVVVCSLILPSENQTFLNLFKQWALPIIELFVVSLIVYRIHRMIKRYKEEKQTTPDFYTALKLTSYDLLPRLAATAVSTEIAVIYYGLIHWKRKTLALNEYSYHKETGSRALLGMLIFIVLVETFILHILLINWSPVLAWVLTGISIYSSIQIIGILKSISQRPILLTDKEIILRYGILNEVTILLEDIDSIEKTKTIDENNSEIKSLSPFQLMEGQNLVLHLRKEYLLNGFYGFSKKFRSISLHIDSPNELCLNLEEQMNDL